MIVTNLNQVLKKENMISTYKVPFADIRNVNQKLLQKVNCVYRHNKNQQPENQHVIHTLECIICIHTGRLRQFFYDNIFLLKFDKCKYGYEEKTLFRW